MKIGTYRSFAGLLVVGSALAVSAAGCTSGNPAQPSTSTSGGASIVAPAAVSPSNASSVAFISQPVKLTVNNAVATTGVALTYTFEVAYDAGFSSKVQTKSGIAQGTGTTTATLDALLAGNTYYWHARADGGGTTGVFGPTFQFKLGAAVSLSAPVPISPITGTFAGPQPNLVVQNATRTGPAGAITYKFEVSNSSSFASIVASCSANEGGTQTSCASSPAVPVGSVFYWRATATDATNSVTSSPSATQSFTSTFPTLAGQLAAQQGLVLWAGVQPPGTNGQIVYGDGWAVQNRVNFDGTPFKSPGIDELHVIDLLDRGMNVFDAVAWLKANGYATAAQAYVVGANIPVVGFPFDYLALDYGYWDIVFRTGA